ncbi:MAG: plastocyanin/azurin family copper-binding protein [Actinomycetota bacterium]
MRAPILVAAAAVVAVSSCGADGPDGTTAAQLDAAAPLVSAVLGQAPPTTPPTVPSTPAPPSTVGDDVSSEEPVDEPVDEPQAFAPNGETVEVRALDNTFRPETVQIEAGTEVLWINGGRNEHNVIPVNDDETWGVDLDGFQPGDEYTFVFDTPGTYRYYCTIHATKDAGMIGAVDVVAPAS